MWHSTFNNSIRFVTAVSMLLAAGLAHAQIPSREQLNSGTVSIITGQPGYLSSRLAADLAAVLDEGDNLRVLAIAGRGAISDLIDTLLLRGIDLAVVPADVLDYVDEKNLLPTMKRRLRVVTRLYNTVAHLVVGRGVRSLNDLRGKKINIVSKYHGEFVAAQNIFEKAKIDYTPVYLDQRLALYRLQRGEIAATLIMSGRPNPLLDEIRSSNELRLIDIPFSDTLPKSYFPINLTSADYPDLILPGQTVKTIATPSIMLVYDFPDRNPRREKVTRFVDAFLGRLTDLYQPPRHPRWRDMNLGAAIAGMERYQTVAAWLQTNKPPVVAAEPRTSQGPRSVQELFKAFIASESADGGAEQLLRLEKPELFARFKAWQKRQRATPASVQPAAPEPQASVRAIFRQFIDAEAARIGKDNVLSLSKEELFDRFLVWRKQGGGSQ